MGAPNPDRVPLSRRRRKCETVGQMIAEDWDVISICRTCGLAMKADLRLVALARGPDFSLWNRNARCRRLFCAGWVEFQAKAPGMTQHEALQAPDPDVP